MLEELNDRIIARRYDCETQDNTWFNLSRAEALRLLAGMDVDLLSKGHRSTLGDIEARLLAYGEAVAYIFTGPLQGHKLWISEREP